MKDVKKRINSNRCNLNRMYSIFKNCIHMQNVMSHCTTHSFEIICRGWKVGLTDHDAKHLYIAQLFDIMYPISTISDILRQGVNSLAQWLEHWISTPAILVRIPKRTWDFFFFFIFVRKIATASLFFPLVYGHTCDTTFIPGNEP